MVLGLIVEGALWHRAGSAGIDPAQARRGRVQRPLRLVVTCFKTMSTWRGWPSASAG